MRMDALRAASILRGGKELSIYILRREQNMDQNGR